MIAMLCVLAAMMVPPAVAKAPWQNGGVRLAQGPATPDVSVPPANVETRPPGTDAPLPAMAPPTAEAVQVAPIPPPPQPVAVRREVLALYDGRFERKLNETRIHRFAEMPLNHLGYSVVYWDMRKGLPDIEPTIQKYRAVLTWFLESLDKPDAYVAWLDKATDGGLKYVALGELAPPEPAELLPALNRVLARIGLEHTGEFVDVTYRAQIRIEDKSMIGFERPVDTALPEFTRMRLVGNAATAHLTVVVPGSRRRSDSAALVTTSPAGGYAAANYTFAYDAAIDRAKWILNPFAFFAKALGGERFPIPDTTTVSGRRLYFRKQVRRHEGVGRDRGFHSI